MRPVRVLSGFVKSARNSNISPLSDRELEIFSFIGRGLSASELANELNVSVKMIETHQLRMKEKLGVQRGGVATKSSRVVSSIRSESNAEGPESEQANGVRLRCF
jgi:DNA-binding CsgD family transcriptional regulator